MLLPVIAPQLNPKLYIPVKRPLSSRIALAVKILCDVISNPLRYRLTAIRNIYLNDILAQVRVLSIFGVVVVA